MIKIYRSLRTNYVTQYFGQNLSPIYQRMGMLGHSGVDFLCWKGEPIYHSGDWSGWAQTEVDNAGGVGVDIISNEPLLNGNRIKLRYWHLERVNVYDGQKIKSGDLIGWGDSTGMSTGDHLHFGFKECDSQGNGLNKGNGYYGGLDPAKYFENIFVGDVVKVKKQALTVIQLARKVISDVRVFIWNWKGR